MIHFVKLQRGTNLMLQHYYLVSFLGCKAILNKAEELMDQLANDHKQYGKVLMAFNKVTKLCFSDELLDGYENAIAEFEKIQLISCPIHCDVCYR